MIENTNQNEVVNTETTNQENALTDSQESKLDATLPTEAGSIAEVNSTDNETEIAPNNTAEKTPAALDKEAKERMIQERLAAIQKTSAPKAEAPAVATPAQKETEEPVLVAEPTAAVEKPTVEADPVAEATPEATKDEEVSLDLDLVEYDGEQVDYNEMSKQDLVDALKAIIDSPEGSEVKDDVEEIKTSFYKKHNAENAEKRKVFLEQGGELTDLKYDVDPLEVELKDYYKKYKEQKAKVNEEIEQSKQKNLQVKYEIIEKIKALTENDESLNQTFQDFKELQQQWREVGPVPQPEMKNLWETYNYQIEKFYDYIKINKELRDLDLKKNLEAKIQLCEKTEELVLETNILRAFKELQKFHAQWREIGPIPREKRDEIWERFKEVTTKINKKHQDFFEKRKEEEKNNLKAKILLCEKAEEIAALDMKSHKDWEDRSKEVVELQKIWKLIGFVPKKDSNKIYDRFREACDEFFNKKREYYTSAKSEQDTNLQLKTELCMQAEALQDSTEWRKTTDEYVRIQKQWKTIGPVSRKHSDAIWKRFRSACNHFFESKSAHFSSIDGEQQTNLDAKMALIEQVKNYQSLENASEDLKALKEFQKQWTEIGHVPFKDKDEMQKKFREAVNAQFEKLETDVSQRNEMKFANKLKTIQQSGKPNNKMRFERDKLHGQLESVQSDILLLENNIGFFAKSKNAESLIADVKRKIENARKQEISIKEKIALMDQYSNQEQ